MRRSGWYGLALEAIEKIARRQRFMTSDDLHDEVAYPPPHFNGTGAVMRQAQKDGTIRTTGRITHSARPSRRGSMVQVWESCLFEPGPTDDSLEAYVEDHERRAQQDPNQGELSL